MPAEQTRTGIFSLEDPWEAVGEGWPTEALSLLVKVQAAAQKEACDWNPLPLAFLGELLTCVM